MRLFSSVRRFAGTAAVLGLVGSALVAPAAAAESVPRLAVAAAVAAPSVSAPIKITPGLKGFDTLNLESPTQLRCLSDAGYSFDMVNTNDPDGTPVGTWQNEYNAAAAVGMNVVLFQGYDRASWAVPSEATRRATIARDKAVHAKYPRGSQIFLNLENNLNGGPSTKMIAWVNTWVSIIRAAGYSPGIYVGAPQLLTVAQINAIPNVVFWRSFSASAPQAARGFVGRQTTVSSQSCGIVGGIDQDIAGTDGRGVQLTGAAFPKPVVQPTAGGALVPLSPTRILDTRLHQGAVAPGALKSVDVQITGQAHVSGTATAVVLNVTAVNPGADGYLSVYPTGGTRSASSLNFLARQTVANLVTVKLGTSGKITVYNGSGRTTDLVADVAGYYLSGTASQPGTFTAVNPSRVLNTRPTGVAGNSSTIVQTAKAAPSGLPYDSVVLNVTAVAPKAGGHLTVYPAGSSSIPATSNVNFLPGRNVPNMVTVPVDTTGPTSGAVKIFNGSAGRTDLLADVAGYYRSGIRSAHGSFQPLPAPTRILDTRRTAAGRVPSTSALSVRVTDQNGMALGGAGYVPRAVVLNVSVIQPSAPGYLSVFPSDQSVPTASSVNFVPRTDIANQVIVPVGPDGRVVLYNRSGGSTDLLADVAGYIRA